MLKIPQARLQQYMNHELPDVQARLEKAEKPEIKLPTSVGSSKKQESSRITSTSDLLTMPKPLTVWITVNWNSDRDGNTRPPDLPPEKTVCKSRSNNRTGHGTTDWFKIGKVQGTAREGLNLGSCSALCRALGSP